MAAQTPVPGCTHHPGMGFVYICKTCDNELLCMDCVVSRHNSHNIGKLTDYVSEQKQQIRQYQEKLSKTDIPKLDGQIQESEENLKESSIGLRKMIEDIKRQGEQIKTEANNLVDKLVTLCRDLMKINADITEKNTAALTKLLGEKLKPQLERCQQVLTSGSNVDVISVARETRNTSTTPPDLRALKTAAFKPGVVYNDLLERMLGTVLVDGENPLYKPIPSPTVVSSFKTPFLYDMCRTCRSGDEAWLSYWKEDNIHRVDQKGNIKEKVECKVKVESITVSPTTGRVWFCVTEDKSIREVMSNGAAVTRFTVDAVPQSLCITQEDMLVVGMEYKGIVMFTSDGRAVSDGAGGVCRQEAVSPYHLTYCRQTGNIAATDSDNVSSVNYVAGTSPGKEPRVIVMDKHLKLKFQCKHLGDITSQVGGGEQSSKFYPGDVCFDGTGDVLVVEKVTKSVVLIDGNNGHFLRTVYIASRSSPYSISLQDDHTCTLWIGHKNSTMQIIKYK
ncbi:uncharacterized protein LOC110454792 [Mizuhopecten yessoensis]|uniref:uncharacterized protein LOC110454792 n=1 Tax=Mizuhopecten yessoensis TaxID=6573 RepID=UPI000B458DE2|nr:uncharacterized protein LOC110454792 [Mizuhopecten yessoensis]